MTYNIGKASNDEFLNTIHSDREKQNINYVAMSLEDCYLDTFNREKVTKMQLVSNRKLLWNRLKKSDEWGSNKNENGEFFVFFRDETVGNSTDQYYVDILYMALGDVKFSQHVPVVEKSLKKPGFNIQLDSYQRVKRLITLQMLS
jgi:hypothetical protein